MYVWGADSMAFNIYSLADPDEELTFIKDRGGSPSLRSKLWQKEDRTKASRNFY